MDDIIPLLMTGANNKDFLIKLDYLQSVTGVGIKVGKQALSSFMLVSLNLFYYDPEELVVLETIKTLGKLLELRLIPKQTLIDDQMLDKILAFLVHPNTWIREETLKFIQILCDYQNTKLLTKADVFCLIGRKIRCFLKQEEMANQFLFGNNTPSDLLLLLKPPLSRNVLQNMVKTDDRKTEGMQSFKMSASDKDAFEILKDVIGKT